MGTIVDSVFFNLGFFSVLLMLKFKLEKCLVKFDDTISEQYQESFAEHLIVAKC